MFTIKTGTQNDHIEPTIYHAKIKSDELLNKLGKKLLHIYYNGMLVMIAENIDGETIYHDMQDEDRIKYGAIYGAI